MIEPGEAWAAVIGVKPVLSKRVETITKDQIAEVMRIEDTIAKRARALTKDAIAAFPIDLVDYQRVLTETSEAMDQPQVLAMIRPLPPADQLPYMTVAQRQFTALQTAIPKANWSTIAGPQPLPPDLNALVEFSALYAALDDPISWAFGAMSDGSMGSELAEAVKLVFPTLTAAITAAIMVAVMDRAATSKGKYILPWRTEIGVAAWMGLPPEVPLPPPPDESEKPDEKGDKDEAGKDAMTQTERIETGT